MFLVSSAQNISGAGRTSYWMVMRAVSAGHEADKSLSCSAETNNEWTLISTPNMTSWSAQSQFYWLFKIHHPQYFTMKSRRLLKLLPVSAAVKGKGVSSAGSHMWSTHTTTYMQFACPSAVIFAILTGWTPDCPCMWTWDCAGRHSSPCEGSLLWIWHRVRPRNLSLFTTLVLRQR
jgi:hypothetical protein